MWTPADLQKLKDIYKTHTEAQLAEIFGVSRDAIKYQLGKQGLTKNRLPVHSRPLTEVKAIYKYSEEHGVKEAAKKFGLSTHTIKNVRRRFIRTLTKRTQKISSESINRLKKSAMNYALRRRPSHAEDYASFCLLKLVEGTFSKHDWIWIEFLKITFGATQTKKGELKVKAETYSEDLENVEVSGEIETKWEEMIQGIEMTWEQRILFLLIYQWGFSQDECARLFDMSSPSISQKMNTVYEKLQGIEFEKKERIARVIRREE